MKTIKNYLYLLIFISVSLCAVKAQVATGGTFKLEQSLIASGGGTSNDPASYFSVTGSIGQPVAGTTGSADQFKLHGGFLSPVSLAPTAASVSIEGRILTADGRGIRNVGIILTNADGTIKTAQSGTFGYFRFTGVTVGQAVVIAIFAKKYHFSEPVRVLFVTDDLSGLDFIAVPEKVTEKK